MKRPRPRCASRRTAAGRCETSESKSPRPPSPSGSAGPLVCHREVRVPARRGKCHDDGLVRAAEVDRVLDEFVQELGERIGHAHEPDGFGSGHVFELARRVRGAVTLDAAATSACEVEALALGRFQQALQARGFRQPRDEATQPVHAFAARGRHRRAHPREDRAPGGCRATSARPPRACAARARGAPPSPRGRRCIPSAARASRRWCGVRSPISSCASSAVIEPRTRPCESMASSASACRRRMRAVRRVAKPRRITSEAPTMASVTASRFSSADSLRSWMAARVLLDHDGAHDVVGHEDRLRRRKDRDLRSRVPRHCVDDTPINARSNKRLRGARLVAHRHRGGGDDEGRDGRQPALEGALLRIRTRRPRRPRTRERVSTTHTREDLLPMIARSARSPPRARTPCPGSRPRRDRPRRRAPRCGGDPPRRVSSRGLAARKSCGRSERAGGEARAVAPIARSCGLAQERFHARDELRGEPRERQQHQRHERQAEADAVEEPRVHRLEGNVDRERAEAMRRALPAEFTRVLRDVEGDRPPRRDPRDAAGDARHDVRPGRIAAAGS